jgi:hypothetical protein
VSYCTRKFIVNTVITIIINIISYIIATFLTLIARKNQQEELVDFSLRAIMSQRDLIDLSIRFLPKKFHTSYHIGKIVASGKSPESEKLVWRYMLEFLKKDFAKIPEPSDEHVALLQKQVDSIQLESKKRPYLSKLLVHQYNIERRKFYKNMFTHLQKNLE